MGWAAIAPYAIPAAATLAGKLLQSDTDRSAANRNVDLQREFAQQGIRWKVADAKAAGIHPLFALGASTTSFQNVVGGGSDYGLPEMGQDIGRAMEAGRTARERADAEATNFMLARARESDARVRQAEVDSERKALFNLQLERGFLENEALKRRISQMDRSQVGPPVPSGDDDRWSLLPGGGAPVHLGGGSVAPSDVVRVKPSDVVSSQGGHPSTEAGHSPAFSEVRVGDSRVIIPSASTAQKTQNVHGMDLGLLTAELVSRMKSGAPPPKELLPPGFHWEWQMWDRTWRAAPDANWSRSLGGGRGSSRTR